MNLMKAPLSDIIRSEAIIEQEKQEGICSEDLEIWAELTDQLGTKEFQIMYQTFKERRLKPEEPLVSQGDKNDGLFFIHQGSLKVSHLVDDRELFITSLSRGQLAGENILHPFTLDRYPDLIDPMHDDLHPPSRSSSPMAGAVSRSSSQALQLL